MNDMFFAGGFLYNSKLKKVLLHKRDDKTKNNPQSWAFFGGLSKKDETPRDTFIRELQEELEIKLNINSIKKLTDYFNPDFNTHRYVFYGEIDTIHSFRLTEGESYGWFTLEETSKLNITKRTRQDLIYFHKTLS